MARYTREQLLKDLKENIVALTIVFKDGNRHQARVTLDLKSMPTGVSFDMSKLDEMHNQHKDVLVGYNVMTGQWEGFHIDTIEYAEAVNV